jgi:hypothetical protein
VHTMGTLPPHSRNVDIKEDGPNRARVLLSGELPIDWASRVTAGIARGGGSIVRGHARRETVDAWDVELEVTTDIKIPIAAVETWLEGATVELPANAPRIASFALTPTQEGPARLVLEASDTVGLLGGCLRAFAMMGVFPVAFEIDTRGSSVYDVFELRGMGQEGMPPDTRARLAKQLERMRDG